MTVAAATKPRKRASVLPDASALLTWYDRHRRKLPWRALPGERPDPYRVWLSEIMLQQTTVRAVAPYYARFLERFPTVEAMARADREDVLRLWAGLGYYARARNLHACAIVVTNEHAGRFPDTEEGLATLPGVGPYTAAAIAAIAFDRPTCPVDGNIERVVTRLFAIEDELPAAKPAIRTHAMAMVPPGRAGDFAQSLMDLGATICTPNKPACALCPFNDACQAYARGDAETFPRKAEKKTGALRRGAAFVVLRGDASLLVRTRGDKGLLGGMTEVPTTEWSKDFAGDGALASAPVNAKWRRVPGAVTHVFTHFPLELIVYAGEVPARTRAPHGMRFVPLAEAGDEAFPNVMRKVLAHAGLSMIPKSGRRFSEKIMLHENERNRTQTKTVRSK
jgi:A/G-specific adenine glycosylase